MVLALLLAAAMPLVQDAVEFPEPHTRTMLRVNPPTFRWPGTKSASRFAIELARTADFRGAKAVEVNGAFWRPLKPLEPGLWHWRVRPAGGAWLPAVSFRIAADLPRWDIPDWNVLMARIPKGRPRLTLRPEQVAAYREKAAGPLREAVREWVKRVEPLLGADLEPTRKKRAAAAPTGDEREDRLRAGKVKTWDAKGYAHRLMDPVEDLCWLWMVTGDARFAAEAVRRVMIAARMDPEKELSDRTSDFANARIVSSGAIAYDMLYDRLSPAGRDAIRRMIVARAAPIFRKIAGGRLFSAHGWQRAYMEAMMGALAVYGDAPEARALVELGLKAFVALYPWYGGLDGGSAEGVNYYTCCDMLSSLEARDLFDAAFGLDFARDNPWYRNNPYYLIYAIPPGGIRSRFGDVNPDSLMSLPMPTHRLAALRMASLFNNGFAADYARRLPEGNGGERLASFRWEPFAAVRPAPLESLPPARAFRDIGMVFMHSNLARAEENVRLEFRSSPYGSTGHSHSDQNSFHIIAFNEPLLLDTGYYTSAGDRHHAGWARQTKAHNTILVDGLGQGREDGNGPRFAGEITRFEQNDAWVYAAGSAAGAYKEVPLARFDRHLVWLRGKDVQAYVIIDDLTAADGKPHRFDWLLHAAREMRLDAEAGRITVTGEKAEARVALFATGPLQMSQNDRFDPPPEKWRADRKSSMPNQWHLAVSAPPAPALRYVAVIQVGRPGFAPLEVSPADASAKVGRWTVRLANGRIQVK